MPHNVRKRLWIWNWLFIIHCRTFALKVWNHDQACTLALHQLGFPEISRKRCFWWHAYMSFPISDSIYTNALRLTTRNSGITASFPITSSFSYSSGRIIWLLRPAVPWCPHYCIQTLIWRNCICFYLSSKQQTCFRDILFQNTLNC